MLRPTLTKQSKMTSKKNKPNNQKITNFFKPFVSSKSAATLSKPVHSTLAPQLKPKVLADSTNIPPKKKNSYSVHNPVKPVVFDVVEVGIPMEVSPSHHFDPFLYFIAL
jgi:hypothetical protein